MFNGHIQGRLIAQLACNISDCGAVGYGFDFRYSGFEYEIRVRCFYHLNPWRIAEFGTKW